MTAVQYTVGLVLFFTCCHLLALSAAGDIGDDCVTPDSRDGVCTLLKDCPTLIAMLAKFKKIGNEASLRYVKNCHCGRAFVKTQPVVCCANETVAGNSNAIGTQTSHVLPNRLLTDIDAKDANVQDNPFDEGDDVDVTGHRNVLLINDDNCGQSIGSKIFGGVEADMHEFPWMALLKYNKRGNTSFSCGGSLINKRYVLTAAHCVVNTKKVGTLTGVRLGEHDTRKEIDCEDTYDGEICSPPPQDIDIETLIPHPGYNSSRLVNDIALIRLKADVVLNTEQVQPVCLPVGAQMQFQDVGGINLTVAGWGSVENSSLSPVLLKTRVPSVDLKSCADKYRPHSLTIVRSQLCAGGSLLRQDSCKGDSGGPLKMYVGAQVFQVGVVSFGTTKCATPSYPGVYTRVGRYMKWILDTIQP